MKIYNNFLYRLCCFFICIFSFISIADSHNNIDYAIKNNIKKDLNCFLIKYNQHWNNQQKQKFIYIVYMGQKEFNINYKIVMSIISVESNYNIVAKGKNKKSIDYGLCQINSRYIKKRYKNTEKYLDKYSIKYSNSYYDIGKNIFSCFLYLKDISKSQKIKTFNQFIAAYNVGINGSTQKQLQSIGNTYYRKFLKEYTTI